jgi:hypothetical protein
MEETFTIHIQPIGDHLQVSIPELGIVLEVQSTKRDDALDAAHNAIIAYKLKEREQEAAKAS